jgi:hypothetical protein
MKASLRLWAQVEGLSGKGEFDALLLKPPFYLQVELLGGLQKFLIFRILAPVNDQDIEGSTKAKPPWNPEGPLDHTSTE